MLTQVLSDSFGGNTRALLIVNVGPSAWDRTQTLDSMKFAKATGLVKNQVGFFGVNEFDLAWDSMSYIQFGVNESC